MNSPVSLFASPLLGLAAILYAAAWKVSLHDSFTRRKPFPIGPLWFLAGGWALHSTALVVRGLGGVLPLPPGASSYDVLLALSWGVTTALLFARLKFRSKSAILLAPLASLCVLLLAWMDSSKSLPLLEPALQNPAFYAFFYLSCISFGFIVVSAMEGAFFVVTQGPRPDRALLSFSILAIGALCFFAGGARFFQEQSLDFFKMAPSANGGFEPVTLVMANGDVVWRYISLPYGGALVLLTLALFVAHLLLGSLAVSKNEEERSRFEAGVLGFREERIDWLTFTDRALFVLGCAGLFGIVALMIWAHFTIPGFRIESNPFRMAILAFTALASPVALGLMRSWSGGGVEVAQGAAGASPFSAQAASDRVSFQCVLAAFPIFTLSLIALAVWRDQAYGTYWVWGSKQMWLSLVWLVYAAYLTGRTQAELSPRTAAALSVIGVTIFSFAAFGAKVYLN